MGSSPVLLRSRVSSARIVFSSFLNTHKKPALGSPPINKRIPSLSRSSPFIEMRCLVSMMPLHSAIASARLTSELSSGAQTWARVPLGLSMPL